MGKFIDVSEHNTIDWNKAKSAVDYAYIRCGVRGSLAKTAPKDYKKIKLDAIIVEVDALTKSVAKYITDNKGTIKTKK